MPNNQNDSELVIGLITTVGTNTSDVIRNIQDKLTQFKYQLERIKVSSDIISEFAPPRDFNSEYDRISYYMDLGNKIREKTGDYSILMKGVVSKILLKRENPANPAPRKRVAYIIDSIKHPDEVHFLRDTYGVGFHLIGISSTRNRRIEFLTKEKGLSIEQAEELLNRDANESEKHGQHTQDAFQNSDYFINISDNTDEIRENIYRLLDLLFGDPFITPTFSEFAMFMAYANSLRSADLSRQIGAVITKKNEIIASGANDCPKVGGGLYWLEYISNRYEDTPKGRDYTLGYDSNKKEQAKMISDILSSLQLEKNSENIKKIKDSGIGDLTEYGRVVHGEMEALLMCSRNNISCRDAEMYVTTFPCHNCAKHIIAAGLKKVIYIEPYPKSKALDFYINEISENPDDIDKVCFVPFVGVGPHRFIDLFSINSTLWYKRKRKDEEGNKITWNAKKASLRNPMNVFNYIDSEVAAYRAYNDLIQNLNSV
ncbi:MAG: anti-phage dCTP deaminase [Bacillota bacterium]|nr:anti-phage dCTP deaminase [Bacillota bacterium]